MNINLRLPPHIIQVIFSKLVVNLPLCRLICKFWNDLILNLKIIPDSFFLCTSGPIGSKIYCVDFDLKHLGGIRFVASSPFVEAHGSYSIANTSCNGLLLVFKARSALRCAGILNPLTNQYIKLPQILKNGPKNGVFCYGFGFSPNTNRYKILRVSIDLENCLSTFDVFTFGGSNQWRTCVDSAPFQICNHGIYFNGDLYWIAVDKKNGYEYVICRFDVENERIETIVTLPGVAPSRWVTLQAFNGTVYATFFLMYPCYEIGVWRMTERDSWVREFVIDDMPKDWVIPIHWKVFIKLLKAYQNGEILCLINSKLLILYNPKIRSIKTLNQVEHDMQIVSIDSFNFNSL